MNPSAPVETKTTTSFRSLALASATVLAFFHPASLQAQTLLNGSFASYGGQQSTTVTGWTPASTSRAASLIATNTEEATAGSYAIAYNANNQATGTETLSQSFMTGTGQTYRVKLNVGALSAPTGQTFLSPRKVESLNGTSVSGGNKLIFSDSGTLLGRTGGSLNQNMNVIQMRDFAVFDARYAAPNAKFSKVTFTFTAQVMSIIDLTTGGAGYQNLVLDDASITAVPARSTRAGEAFEGFGGPSLTPRKVESLNGTSVSGGNKLIFSDSGTLLGRTGGSLNQNTDVIQMRDFTGVDATYGAASNAEFGSVTSTSTAQSTTSAIASTDLSTGGAGPQDVTDVPEPATWAGGALLLAGAGLTLRRRLRRAAILSGQAEWNDLSSAGWTPGTVWELSI